MADSVGMADLRAEVVDPVVKGFALEEYRMLQFCNIVKTSAWTNKYQIETATELTGGTGSAIKGVPRLANFPYGEVTWTEAEGRLLKHGMDGVISWEDAKTSNIDVVARSLLRIARAVANSVDTAIWDALVAATTGTQATEAEWDNAVIANRNPIQDILNAQEIIALQNYDPYSGGWLLLNPEDFAHLIGNSNVRNSGQFYTADVTRNGRVGRLLGLNIIVSNVVAVDKAFVITPNCINWYEAKPLSTVLIEDPGIKYTVRGWQVGVPIVINPLGCCELTNTAV